MGSPRIDELTPEAMEERGARLIAEGNKLVAVAAVRRALASQEWIDQTNSPLGRRRHNELARSGKIPAKKLRGRWMIRRDDLNSYIEKHGLTRGRRSEDEDVSDIIDRVMKSEGGAR